MPRSRPAHSSSTLPRTSGRRRYWPTPPRPRAHCGERPGRQLHARGWLCGACFVLSYLVEVADRAESDSPEAEILARLAGRLCDTFHRHLVQP